MSRMRYSDGTPAPGFVGEAKDQLWLVTGLNDRGEILATNSTRLIGFSDETGWVSKPNIHTFTEWELR